MANLPPDLAAAVNRVRCAGSTGADPVAALDSLAAQVATVIAERDAVIAGVVEALDDLPHCSGEWLAGSGGHRRHGECARIATWWHPDDTFAYCDEHIKEFERGDGTNATHGGKPGGYPEAPWAAIARVLADPVGARAVEDWRAMVAELEAYRVLDEQHPETCDAPARGFRWCTCGLAARQDAARKVVEAARERRGR